MKAYGMQRQRYEEITGRIPGKKVLVLGDVGVDLRWRLEFE